MPNPYDPDEAECHLCHDMGYVPGTYRLCHRCSGGDAPFNREQHIIDNPEVFGAAQVERARSSIQHPFTAQLAVIDGGESRVCGIRVDGTLCHKRREEHTS